MAPRNSDKELHQRDHSDEKRDGEGTLPRVRDFFRGKNVFLTGGSGFLGRTLIEKLLREAPDIGSIFVLLRPKKGKTPQERLAPMTDVKLFDRLRREQPTALNKLRALAGDVEERGLGLSDEDAALLREAVHVVFHVAASVRFNEPLKKAVLLNVRGTREMCELARGMVNLKVLVHVSTAFCNSDKLVNEEKLYPSPGDWRTYVKAAENVDEELLEILCKKICGGHPNTYVFTKALAEHVIAENKDSLPVGIIRPSVVLPSSIEPYPGWVDNLYGPLGIILACTIGANHTNVMTSNDYLDCIPVDEVTRGMILIAMTRAEQSESGILPIVNASFNGNIVWNGEESSKVLRIANFDFPSITLYKPFTITAYFVSLYYIFFYLIDFPIAMAYDILFKIQGRNERIMSIYGKIFLSYRRFFTFFLRHLQFPNEKFLQLSKRVSSFDKTNFEVSSSKMDIIPYHFNTVTQLKRNFNRGKKYNLKLQYIVLEVLHYAVSCLLLGVIWYTKLPSIFIYYSVKIIKFSLMI